MSIRSNTDKGRLDQRITLQRRTVTQNATTGNPTTTWADLITCWAAADAVKVSDRYKEPHSADSTLQISATTFWIRTDIHSRHSLRVSDRLVWRGVNFDIQDILDQQLRGRLLALICMQGESDG